MKLRIKALLSLRWNYTWKGVWFWLKGKSSWCPKCFGKRRVPRNRFSGDPAWAICIACLGKPKRGYQRILSEPEQVIAEQEAAAEGVFV